MVVPSHSDLGEMKKKTGDGPDGGVARVRPADHVLYGDLKKASHPQLTRGEGVYVFDSAGRRYLDAVGGVGVVNIGHGVGEIADAIAHQARTLAFAYAGEVDNSPRRELAERLQRWVPEGMGSTRVLFCSGGAEATEAALKLAYQYHWERGHRSKLQIVSRWQSYHGNTLGALSLSGRTQWRRMFAPYLLGFPHIPPPYCLRCAWNKTYPDCGMACAWELQRVVRQHDPDNVSAFIAEPVIGTSLSAVVPPSEYYPIVRTICDEHDLLLIADEVMSGIGRTGAKFGIDHWNVVPDIITVAKGISSGYAPLAAVILAEHVWRAIEEGTGRPMHSYTYGGNPLSCAAGRAVLDYIERHDLVESARRIGAELKQRLVEEVGSLPHVAQVRGIGLFLGVELVEDRRTNAPFPPQWDVTHRIVEKAFSKGLMILGGVTGSVDGIAGDHFEILPPYTIETTHVEEIVGILKESIGEVLKSLPEKRGEK